MIGLSQLQYHLSSNATAGSSYDYETIFVQLHELLLPEYSTKDMTDYDSQDDDWCGKREDVKQAWQIYHYLL